MIKFEIVEKEEKRYIDNNEIIFETNCPINRESSILRIFISIVIILVIILLNFRENSLASHTFFLARHSVAIMSIFAIIAFLIVILPSIISMLNVSYFIMTKTNLYTIKNNIVSCKVPLEDVYVSIRDVHSWTFLHNTKFISFFKNNNNKIKFIFECTLNGTDENKNILFINTLSALSNRGTTEFTDRLDMLEPKIAIFGGRGTATKLIKQEKNNGTN